MPPYPKPHEWFKPARARKNILARITVDCQLIHGDPREINLCFRGDPFPNGYATDADIITPDALTILAHYKMNVKTLTKGIGIHDDISDLWRLYRTHRWKYGVTLTGAPAWIEAGAADAADRMQQLEIAKSQGVRTWVSIEPVWDPVVALNTMEAILPYVDEWKVGKLNYDRRARYTNWQTFAQDAKKLLKGKTVYWKKDLLAAAGMQEEG
jgi:DNA repair photolyase